MDQVRCPACRGAKKVAKLGGVVGECNTCSGEGKIKACDKPVMIIPQPMENINNIKSAVANALPVTLLEVKSAEPVALSEEPQIKVDPKKAIYKRKTTSK